jgi:hypothetical protein
MAAISLKPSCAVDTYLELITRQHSDLLARMAETEEPPSQTVLDDLLVFNYILMGDDPNALASQFRVGLEKLRIKEATYFVARRDVAKLLGWRLKEAK